VGYLLAGKDEAENNVRIDYQKTTSEDKEDITCAEVTVIFRVCKPVRLLQLFVVPSCVYDNDDDNNKPIKSLLKGKGLLPLVGLARLDS
jgi:hypothetical protein